jgi:endonuclease/exonuclease/phosphatase family metal-dependent hydrolase
LIFAACSDPQADGTTVLLDGLFEEWREAATLIDDAADAPAAEIDILSIQALDDGRWLYLALDVGNEVSLQALPGTLHLLVDADGDRSTGLTQHRMDGVDLVVDLAQTVVSAISEDRRLGFGVRLADYTGRFEVGPRHGLGLIAQPTWSAPRFEIRLARRGIGGLPPLGDQVRLKAVYVEGDSVLDETDVGSYLFVSRAAEAAVDAGDPGVIQNRMRPRAGAVRVAAWNVSRNVFRRPQEFAGVLAAVAPDVVLLDELPPDATEELLSSTFQSGPLGALGSWSFVLGDPGVGQRSAVAARDLPVAPAEALLDIPYPAGSLEALRADVDSPWLDAMIDMTAAQDRGLSTAGAWVEVEGTRVLFVAMDLQAAGWTGSPRDRVRVIEAGAIRERVASELAGRPAPVVMGGDLNLVGSRTPLFRLIRGLDVDGTDLLPVDAERLGERTLATWRSPRDAFAPGRLDFLLVPDAAVTVANSFVFATEDLDEASLTRLGLERELMLELSDHLVVVADLLFAWPRSAGAPTRPQPGE